MFIFTYEVALKIPGKVSKAIAECCVDFVEIEGAKFMSDYYVGKDEYSIIEEKKVQEVFEEDFPKNDENRRNFQQAKEFGFIIISHSFK